MTDIIRIGGDNLPEKPLNPYAHREFPMGIESEEDIEKLIDRFLMDTQNISETTKKRYKKSLKIYFRWVTKSGFKLNNITLSELLMYRKDLEGRKISVRGKEGDGLSTYTISAYLVSVKEFYGWASGIGLMTNPALNLQTPKRDHKFKREPLDEEQMEKLLNHFKTKNKRDYALLCTMYYCGLRTIELSRLDVGDITEKSGVRVIFVQGKGRDKKDEWVKFNDKAYLPMMDYLSTREGLVNSSPLFASDGITAKGSRIVPDTISRIAKAGLKAIGLDGDQYTAHGIRHSAATNAIRQGATLEQVQEMLRHKNSSTTKIYGEMALEEKRLKNKSAEDFL